MPDSDDWFSTDVRLPYPQWETIGDWIVDNVAAEAFDEAYTQAVRLWFARFVRAAGSGLCATESPNFCALCPFEKSGRRWLLQTLESARRAILEALGTLAWSGTWGKQVALVLPPRLYARYTSHYFDSDYMGRSAGLMITGGGFAHIAVQVMPRWDSDQQMQRTMAHELTHNALCHLKLPRWLDEGIAMSFEDQLGGGEVALADRLGATFEGVGTRALMAEFTDWWTPERVQGFWSGELWNSEQDERALCYELARLLFRLIRQSADGNRAHFRSFIGEAGADDAGEAAAQQYLGRSLGDLVMVILGEGDWSPEPVLW